LTVHSPQAQVLGQSEVINYKVDSPKTLLNYSLKPPIYSYTSNSLITRNILFSNN